MDITTFAVYLSVPIIFLIIGYTFDSYLCKFISTLLLLMFGFFVITSPIATETGTNTTIINSTFTLITYDYTPIPDGHNTIMAVVISMLGLGIGYFTGRDYIQEGRNNEG